METYFRVNKITEHDIPYGDFKEYLYHEKNVSLRIMQAVWAIRHVPQTKRAK